MNRRRAGWVGGVQEPSIRLVPHRVARVIIRNQGSMTNQTCTSLRHSLIGCQWTRSLHLFPGHGLPDGLSAVVAQEASQWNAPYHVRWVIETALTTMADHNPLPADRHLVMAMMAFACSCGVRKGGWPIVHAPPGVTRGTRSRYAGCQVSDVTTA